MLSRRGMVGGLLVLAAPAIIRTPGLLMPISMAREEWSGIRGWWGPSASLRAMVRDAINKWPPGVYDDPASMPTFWRGSHATCEIGLA
jgi:hypothetical protein